MATKTETCELKMHPAMLFEVIKGQAGTLAKALLEAVMNAIDAGATKCHVTLDLNQFTVKDDGKGITDRVIIDDFFATFGTPHKEGDARYGKYRMGRGQLFAFAINTWRTGSFKMVVDIQKDGLNFDLTTGMREAKGCFIEGKLYEPLEQWRYQDAVEEFKQFVAYADIPVYLNGKLISQDPAKQKWDIVTDDAYIKLNNSTKFAVYNLGVLVRDYGAYRMGTGGVVVSRRQLSVNFARNDILEHSCSVWGRIRDDVRKRAGVKVAKKKTLTDSERQFLASQFTTVERYDYGSWSEVAKANIVPTSAGKHASVDQLLRAETIVLVNDKNARIGERLHRSKAFFGVTEETLNRFGVSTVEDLVARLKERSPMSYAPQIAKIDDYLANYQAGMTTVMPTEMQDVEKIAFATLQSGHAKHFAPWLARKLKGDYTIEERTLLLGESDAALAWTDGKKSVHFERKFLTSSARKGIDGWLRIVMVMVHEYCHNDPDLEGHEHGPEFFEMFEDLATNARAPFATMAAWCAARFNEQCLKEDIKLSRSQLYRTSQVSKTVAVASNDEAVVHAAKLIPVAKVIKPIETLIQDNGQFAMIFD